MSVHTRFVAKLLAAAFATAVQFAVAQADDNTRYISITGSNANACTLAAPCRTLQRGIRVTPAGGELRILDSGFYGNNASINKSLTISGNGNTIYLGSVLTIGGDLNHVVALRELVLNGQNTFTQGILINQAAAVHIERCVIHGFTQNGISVGADDVEVFVRDSISRDNGSNGFRIVFTGASRVSIDNSRFDNNAGSGVQILSGHGTITRSTAAGNLRGFEVGGTGTMTVESSVASGNVSGLRVNIGDVARISNSTFTGNAVGISNNSGTVETRGNNTVRGNTNNDVSGAPLTPIGGM